MPRPAGAAPWRSSVLVPALALSACWRDAPPPAAPAAPSGAIEALSCSPLDDAKAPPLDPERGRLRSHITGNLSANPRLAGKRTWTGEAVPAFVPKALGSLELFLLDAADAGYLALYREPYDLQSCKLGGESNCAYEARHYDARGTLVWRLQPNALFSRGDHLEIQDIRLAGGVLYFNEACQSYSSGADGACSSLVAVDPAKGKVLWRTPPLTSNSRFVVRGCYLVAGYGFTSEPDHVSLVSRATGAVLQRVPLASAPEKMSLVGRDQLDVEIYSGAVGRFRLVDFDGATGRLDLLDDDPSFGGASYGGASYGGRPAGPYRMRRP